MEAETTGPPERVLGYLGRGGSLDDWSGKPIGYYRTVSTWKTPGTYLSSTISQVTARVDGHTYKGRSRGLGMIFVGKLSRHA